MLSDYRSNMKKIFEKTFRIALGVVLALSLVLGTAVSSDARDSLPEADFLSFKIPSEFVPSAEPGVFLNRNHPMESSSISYSVYYNGEDKVLTNRERAAAAADPKASSIPADESMNLTRDVYEETVSAAYNSSYAQNVGYKVSSFENIKVDGLPGYRIEADYQLEGQERVYQTVIMVISRYRTFTVTYQRAEDDYCQEQFEASIETLHAG